MSTYKALRKNPSAPQADAKLIAALREIPLAALSDNMHRNIGTVGLQPYHRPGTRRWPARPSPRVRAAATT